MKLATLAISTLFSLTAPMAIASGNHAGGHDHGEPKAAHSHSHDSGHSHDNGGHDDHNMSGDKNKMFLKKKKIDGYDVTFHVMDAKDGMKMGDESHHFMIKVEDKGKQLNNIKINSKIIFPNGKAESKMLMKMGDWYMAGYNLASQGKYQLMILFKTADGQKHSGGVYYAN